MTHATSTEQRKLVNNSVAREMEEADEIIGQMEMELLSLPPATRAALAPKVKGFKEQVKGFKKDLVWVCGPSVCLLVGLRGCRGADGPSRGCTPVPSHATQAPPTHPAQATSNTNSDREALLGGASGSAAAAAVDQRARLMQGTERLQDGSRRLEEAKRIAMETEHVGISTLEDLNRQREQLERTKDTLNSADTWITKSQGLIKGMQNR
jgi:vesicle transport through interaction with t-SNAREs protein 1